MKNKHIILAMLLLGALLSCGKNTAGETETPDAGTPGPVTLRFATKALTGSDLPGIDLGKAPNWGLYVFSKDREDITYLDNCKMDQGSPEGYTEADFYPSNGVSGTISTVGGIIVSAYYPYRADEGLNSLDEPNYIANPDDIPLTRISPCRTVVNGHPAMHFGIPMFYRSRYPRLESFGTKAGDIIEDNARDVILYASRQEMNVNEIQGRDTIYIEITPLTCHVTFKFSLAPERDAEGNYLPDKDQPTDAVCRDYEILSVTRHHPGENDAAEGDDDYVPFSTFRYDMRTGEIRDQKYRSGGLVCQFPPEVDDKYVAPVNPYRPHVNAAGELVGDPDENSIVEFICFPTTMAALEDILIDLKFRYRIAGGSTPDPSDDEWVTSTATFNAFSTGLKDGWMSGVIYRYHVYFDRKGVLYTGEIEAWEDKDENDIYFGDIQV